MTRAMLIVLHRGRPISALYKNGDGFPAVILTLLEDVVPHVIDLQRTSYPSEAIVSELHRHLRPEPDVEEGECCCSEWIDFFPYKEGYISNLHEILVDSYPDYTYYFTVDRLGMVWLSVCAYSIGKPENQVYFGLFKDAAIWKDRIDKQAIGWGYHDEVYDSNGNYFKQKD